MQSPPASNMIDTSAAAAATAQQPSNPADNEMASNMEDDQNYQFYKEYCRLYYANIILTNRLQ